MTGRVIEDDMFGVCRRLKSIDDGYFVFLNYKTGKFEVHNSACAPHTLCLVLPYETLDERTVGRVLKTRVERLSELVAEAERSNAKLDEAARSARADKLVEAVCG